MDDWGFDHPSQRRPDARQLASLGRAGQSQLLIDRQNGVGGFWATQILPFADPTSVDGDLDFESAVYAGALKPAAV